MNMSYKHAWGLVDEIARIFRGRRLIIVLINAFFRRLSRRDRSEQRGCKAILLPPNWFGGSGSLTMSISLSFFE